jgi:L-threonylcarbamoyladenylate synthase
MKLYTSVTDPQVIASLQAGNVGVLPADTVYGLMGLARLPEVAPHLYGLKQRDNKPGTIIAASIDQLVELGLKRRYMTAVEQYWPGSISVIIPCGHELEHLHLGMQSLAVRIPDDAPLLELLKQTGPLVTSSANLTGQPTAVNVEQAQKYFGDQVAFYVDGGDLSDRLPSTVIRIVDDAIEVLRQGAVRVE